MIAFLARHEWKLLAADEVVRVVVAVFAAAIVLASLLGVWRGIHEQRSLAACECYPSPRLQSPSLRADAVANERGSLAWLPPAPLAALAVGQSDVHPGYVKVTARRLDPLVTGDQVEHPLALASGHFDVAFVVLFLYPLLIFAVSFDLTATERDRGTLRMVLAQPVRLAELVAGKMIARALLLGIPMVWIPLVIAAAAVDGPAWRTAMPLWTAAVLAYGAVWHGIALIVNARGWNGATNALVLAGVWLMFAVVGPATINLVIAVAYPMPSRVEAAVEARAATRDATVQGNRELGQFLQDHPTSANVGQEGMRQFARLQAARDQQVAERLTAVESAFDRQLQRQQRLAAWLSVLSPTMVAQQVLLEAAGTGTARLASFEAAARQFQGEWRSYFEPRVLDAATLTEEEIAAAPAFAFVEPPYSRTLLSVVPAIAAMLIAGVALVWLGFRQYRGYAP